MAVENEATALRTAVHALGNEALGALLTTGQMLDHALVQGISDTVKPMQTLGLTVGGLQLGTALAAVTQRIRAEARPRRRRPGRRRRRRRWPGRQRRQWWPGRWQCWHLGAGAEQLQPAVQADARDVASLARRAASTAGLGLAGERPSQAWCTCTACTPSRAPHMHRRFSTSSLAACRSCAPS